MFPEADGAWRAVLSKVVESGNYYVRAYRARSERYSIEVVTVPVINTSRVRIVQPEYAGRNPYDGPLPREGASGLWGTKVQVFLQSNRPLSGGTIAFWGGTAAQPSRPSRLPERPGDSRRQPDQAGKPPEHTERLGQKPLMLPMQPVEPGSQEVVGEFTIAGDGRFECRVVDAAGQPSQQTFSGNVVLLPDEWPFVRIIQPQKVSLATPTAWVPVVVSARTIAGSHGCSCSAA